MKLKEWLILIFLGIIILITFLPKKEYFIDSVKMYQQYPSNSSNKESVETNYLKKLYGLNLDLETDLLFMDRCIKFKQTSSNGIREIDTLMAQLPFPYQKKETMITNMMDLEKQIMIEIETFYLKYNLKQMRGPIYVLVLQAPYLRVIDENCNVRDLSVQFNVKDYQQLGYLMKMEESDVARIQYPNGCPQVNTSLEKTKVVFYLLYPAYNNKIRPAYLNWENIKCNMMFLLNQREFEDKCFIKCKDSSQYVCGCLNQNEPYKSRCIETNGDLINYGILYLINGQEASRRVKGTMGISFFADTTPIKPTGIMDEAYCRDLSNRAPLPSI